MKVNRVMFSIGVSEPETDMSERGKNIFALLHAGFSLRFFFDPEDRSDMFLRKVH
jgi:hypothetical protein